RLSPRGSSLVLVGGEDRGEPLDQGPGLTTAPPGLELGFEDLAAALNEPPEQGQILAFGKTLVALLAELVDRQITQPGQIGLVADPIDPSMAVRLAHGRDSTPGRPRSPGGPPDAIGPASRR